MRKNQIKIYGERNTVTQDNDGVISKTPAPFDGFIKENLHQQKNIFKVPSVKRIGMGGNL